MAIDHRLLGRVQRAVGAAQVLHGPQRAAVDRGQQPDAAVDGAETKAVALGLGQLAYGGDRTSLLSRLRPRPLLAAGLLTCLAVGLFAMALGEPFLTPQHEPKAALLGFTLSPVTLFDVGIYLMVLGLIAAAVDRLGALQVTPADDTQDAEDTHGAEEVRVR